MKISEEARALSAVKPPEELPRMAILFGSTYPRSIRYWAPSMQSWTSMTPHCPLSF